MKKLFTLITLTTVAFGLPAGSFAAEKKMPAAAPAEAPADGPAKAAKAEVEKVVGQPRAIALASRVDSIDAASKTFTHKNEDGKEVKFIVTEKTEIKNGNAAATFEDIKVGDFVNGSRIKKSETEYEVVKITKIGPKPEKPAKAEKPKADKPAKADGDAKPEPKKED